MAEWPPTIPTLTYGLDGAFPSQMQPALLNIYEWASVEWHQYLGHQSRSNGSIRLHQPDSTATGGDLTPAASLARRPNESRHALERRLHPAEASHHVQHRFLPLITPTSFSTSAVNSNPSSRTQPLSSVSKNCRCYCESRLVTGQKRKHEAILYDQNGDGDIRTTMARKKPSSLAPPGSSLSLSRWEPAEASKEPEDTFLRAREVQAKPLEAEGKGCALISSRIGNLAEMPRLYRDETTEKKVKKQDTIWVDENDSWNPIELERQKDCSVLFEEDDNDSNGSCREPNPDKERSRQLGITTGRFK